MQERKLSKGEIVWSQMIQPKECFILIKGRMCMIGDVEIGSIDILEGHFVGDFPSLLDNEPCKTIVSALSACTIFSIGKGDFVDFLRCNPGLLVFFNDKFIVE